MAFTEKYVTNAGAGTADGSSLANAWSWVTMLTSLSAGQRANVQGAITRTTNSDTFTNNATTANPMSIRGINSALDDLEANGRTRGGSLVTTNFPTITYTTGKLTLPSNCICEHISLTSAISGTSLVGNASMVVRRCVIANTHATSASAIAITIGTGVLIDCDISCVSSSSSAKAIQSNAAGLIYLCKITGNTSGGGCVDLSGASGRVIACVLQDAGFGVTSSGASTGLNAVFGCSFRNITNNYLKTTATTGSFHCIANNVAWGSGGSSQWYSANGTVSSNNQFNNFIGNMGVSDADLGNWINRYGVTLTADPFTSSTDLTLNNTSGGGALVRGAGHPAYLDGGAWQHQDAGGGGGGAGTVLGTSMIRGID